MNRSAVRFHAGLVSLASCVAFAGAAAGGDKAPKALAYRAPGSTSDGRAQVALVYKTDAPMSSVLRVLEVDGHRIEPGPMGENTAKTEYLELLPGRHELLLSGYRAGMGGSVLAARPYPLTIDVLAGKEYVLWAEIHAKGVEKGLSTYDEFCVSDYCGTSGSSIRNWSSRCEKARANARKQLDAYWTHRPLIAVAPLAR